MPLRIKLDKSQRVLLLHAIMHLRHVHDHMRDLEGIRRLRVDCLGVELRVQRHLFRGCDDALGGDLLAHEVPVLPLAYRVVH